MFSHPEEMIEEEKEANVQENKPIVEENIENIHPKYILHGALVHLGKSVHCGHYVSYLRHQEKPNEWVLFNDRKVAKTDEPLIGKAYAFLLRRVE